MPALSKVSIIIPTLNAASALATCLPSIRSQDYPQTKIEIIIADGGSTDDTISIAQKFACRIIPNPRQTSEAGKAVGLSQARGQFVAFIDSDNILPDPDWLNRLLRPFSEHQLIATEPYAFTYRRQAGFIERYSALLGANDPYAFFLGIYDRFSYLTHHWTGLNIATTDYPDYILLHLTPHSSLPTLGANGTIFRTDFLKTNFTGDFLFDIDVIYHALTQQPRTLYFAKVKVGIIHTYCESSIPKFIRKQTRRIKDIFTYQHLRRYPWNKSPLSLVNIAFPLYSFSLVLPLIDGLRGFWYRPDPAWFFHPLACLLTTAIYSYYSLLRHLGFNLVQSRHQWRQ